MKRKELLNSKEYWLINIQNQLFGVIEKYMSKKKLNRTKLAEELNVTKGYVTQILNGDFDHKVSKLVDLSLACDTVPLLYFVSKDEYFKTDNEDKFYGLMPMQRGKEILFSENNAYPISVNGLDFAKIDSDILLQFKPNDRNEMGMEVAGYTSNQPSFC